MFIDEKFSTEFIFRSLFYLCSFTLVLLSFSGCSYDNPVNTSPQIDQSTSLPFEVQNVIQNNCTMCHSKSPTQKGYISAPHGVKFDTEKEILSLKRTIIKVALIDKIMPPQDKSEAHQNDDSHSHEEEQATPVLDEQEISILTDWMNEL